MSRRRKRGKGKKWVKKTDLKRLCSSGKRGYAQAGEAQAVLSDAVVYKCEECRKFHLADPVRRRARQARARMGRR